MSQRADYLHIQLIVWSIQISTNSSSLSWTCGCNPAKETIAGQCKALRQVPVSVTETTCRTRFWCSFFFSIQHTSQSNNSKQVRTMFDPTMSKQAEKTARLKPASSPLHHWAGRSMTAALCLARRRSHRGWWRVGGTARCEKREPSKKPGRGAYIKDLKGAVSNVNQWLFHTISRYFKCMYLASSPIVTYFKAIGPKVSSAEPRISMGINKARTYVFFHLQLVGEVAKKSQQTSATKSHFEEQSFSLQFCGVFFYWN